MREEVTQPAAVKARFVDYRTVKSRSAWQFILEVPVEMADEVLRVLGGTPLPGLEKWCAVARLVDVEPSLKNRPDLVEGLKAEMEKAPLGSPPPARKDERTSADKAVQHCAILCERDEEWQAFIEARARSEFIYVGPGPEATAERVRRLLEIESRAEIGKDPQAYGRWLRLLTAFEQTINRFAEQRG